MRDRWERLSTPQKLGIVAAVVVGAPILIAGGIAGAKDSSSGDKAAPAASTSGGTPGASTAAAAARTSKPAPGPTFTYPGDPECSITYQDAGGGRMSWTIVHTVAGTLRTHATDTSGSIHQHTEHVDAGSTRYFADVPIGQITDIGGNLDADSGHSYGCSVRPAG